jgi:hypothetical protein
MSTPDLLVTIEILDTRGEVVEERLATTYRKLLDAAHAENLSGVCTEVVPHQGDAIIVRATVTTGRGSFTGIGDASASNVPEKLRSALPRVAETRAVCRALRAALCVGYLSVEELSDPIRFPKGQETSGTFRKSPPGNSVERMENRRAAPPGRDHPAPTGDDRGGRPRPFRGRDDRPEDGTGGERIAMSSAQRSLLFRLAYEEGLEGDAARKRVLDVLGVQRLEHATRTDASRAIENLKRSAGPARNGQSNGASHGGA